MGRPIEVKVNQASDIDPEKRPLINSLTIASGSIGYGDMKIIRRMCNCIVDGKRTGGNLSFLDLSACTRVYIHKDEESFSDCITLRSIILRSNAYISSSNAFSGCTSLECIDVRYGNYEDNRISSRDGVLFDSSGKRMLKYPANKGTEYTIPSSTTEIADYAFENSHLTKLFMPQVPPTCQPLAFEGVDTSQITFIVPHGSFDSYWIHPIFGKFNIEELEE